MFLYRDHITGEDVSAQVYYKNLRHWLNNAISNLDRKSIRLLLKKQFLEQGKGYQELLGSSDPDYELVEECRSYMLFLQSLMQSYGIDYDEIRNEINNSPDKAPEVPFSEPDTNGLREWHGSIALLARSLIFLKKENRLPVEWKPAFIFQLVEGIFTHNKSPIRAKIIENAWYNNFDRKKLKDIEEIRLFAQKLCNILFEAANKRSEE